MVKSPGTALFLSDISISECLGKNYLRATKRPSRRPPTAATPTAPPRIRANAVVNFTGNFSAFFRSLLIEALHVSACTSQAFFSLSLELFSFFAGSGGGLLQEFVSLFEGSVNIFTNYGFNFVFHTEITSL